MLIFFSSAFLPRTLFQFLLELSSPLGAEGNHPAAGRYAMMLKSAPDFDHTFKKVRIVRYLLGKVNLSIVPQ